MRAGKQGTTGDPTRARPRTPAQGAAAGAGVGAGARASRGNKSSAPKRVVGVDLKKVIYFVFDIETTGFHRTRDRIIQIAMRKLDATGKPSDRSYSTLVYTDRICSPHVLAVHHINKAKLEGKPQFKVVAQQLVQYMESFKADGVQGCLVAHNGVSFDLQMLAVELDRAQVVLPEWVKLEVDTVRYCLIYLFLLPAALPAHFAATLAMHIMMMMHTTHAEYSEDAYYYA